MLRSDYPSKSMDTWESPLMKLLSPPTLLKNDLSSASAFASFTLITFYFLFSSFNLLLHALQFFLIFLLSAF